MKNEVVKTRQNIQAAAARIDEKADTKIRPLGAQWQKGILSISRLTKPRLRPETGMLGRQRVLT